MVLYLHWVWDMYQTWLPFYCNTLYIRIDFASCLSRSCDPCCSFLSQSWTRRLSWTLYLVHRCSKQVVRLCLQFPHPPLSRYYRPSLLEKVCRPLPWSGIFFHYYYCFYYYYFIILFLHLYYIYILLGFSARGMFTKPCSLAAGSSGLFSVVVPLA